MMNQPAITYEQPVNELTRVCLRLEFLFKQLKNQTQPGQKPDIQYTVALLIDIIRVLDRPDFKSKITQELHRYISIFAKLRESPDIDAQALNEKLKELHYFLDYLTKLPGKLGQTLRDNEFLTMIRLQLNSPGSGCCTSMPAYKCWLERPLEKNIAQIKQWLSTLDAIEKITQLILSIVRGTGKERSLTADNGFYHEAMQTSPSCQLLRITLPQASPYYPEISAGKHRLTIRFITDDLLSQEQVNRDINFQLTCCCI